MFETDTISAKLGLSVGVYRIRLRRADHHRATELEDLTMRIIVHIGFHKTGTTSIQRFLGSSRDKLKNVGIAYFSGRHIIDSHAELHVASMRNERLSPFKFVSGVRPDATYIETTRSEIGRFLDCSKSDTFVFSGEGLSYLRYEDEIDRLRYLMHGLPVEIVWFERNAAEWRESYAAELMKNNMPESNDKESVAYLGQDSWLMNFGERINIFHRRFGSEMVHRIDYDNSLLRDGSVIGSFLDTLGCRQNFDAAEWRGIWDNAR